MKDHLSEFKNELQHSDSKAKNAILEWKCVSKVLFDYIKTSKQFYTVKHENVCLHPQETFKELYNALNIPFTQRVKRRINRHTSADKVESDKPGDLKRDASKLVSVWKNKLSEEEKRRVREETYELAEHYYPENEW